MEKISRHAALSEKKTLKNRIYRAIEEGTYVIANKASNTKIKGKTIDEIRKDIQGSYDKVMDLINRRESIIAALVTSNAGVKPENISEDLLLEIAGKKMTVAVALEMKKSSLEFRQYFVDKMKEQFKTAVNKVNKENDNLQLRADLHVKDTLGTEPNREDAEKAAEVFKKANTWDLIDPLQIEKRINELDDFISDFLMKVDARLSESNATTYIEIQETPII